MRRYKYLIDASSPNDESFYRPFPKVITCTLKLLNDERLPARAIQN